MAIAVNLHCWRIVVFIVRLLGITAMQLYPRLAKSGTRQTRALEPCDLGPRIDHLLTNDLAANQRATPSLAKPFQAIGDPRVVLTHPDSLIITCASADQIPSGYRFPGSTLLARKIHAESSFSRHQKCGAADLGRSDSIPFWLATCRLYDETTRDPTRPDEFRVLPGLGGDAVFRIIRVTARPGGDPAGGKSIAACSSRRWNE
jgi:hypothetical protein